MAVVPEGFVNERPFSPVFLQPEEYTSYLAYVVVHLSRVSGVEMSHHKWARRLSY